VGSKHAYRPFRVSTIPHPLFVRERERESNKWKSITAPPPLAASSRRTRDSGDPHKDHPHKQVRARYGIEFVRVYVEASRENVTAKRRTSTSKKARSRPWREGEAKEGGGGVDTEEGKGRGMWVVGTSPTPTDRPKDRENRSHHASRRISRWAKTLRARSPYLDRRASRLMMFVANNAPCGVIPL